MPHYGVFSEITGDRTTSLITGRWYLVQVVVSTYLWCLRVDGREPSWLNHSRKSSAKVWWKSPKTVTQGSLLEQIVARFGIFEATSDPNGVIHIS